MITREFALGEVNAALAELRSGKICGRAVILPGADAPSGRGDSA